MSDNEPSVNQDTAKNLNALMGDFYGVTPTSYAEPNARCAPAAAGAVSKKSIFMAVTAYTGSVHLTTSQAMVGSACEILMKGWELALEYHVSEAIISRARNSMVSQFKNSECTDMVFIDHDVGWSPKDIIRLCSHPVDVVAGVYRIRYDPEDYRVQWLPKKHLYTEQDTGLIEVAGVPAGFLRLSRACIDKMIDAYSTRLYPDPSTTTGKAWALFDSEFSNGMYWGEDLTFCRRWRDIGGKVWVDPEIPLTHSGIKTYSGSLGEWLRRRKTVSEAA